MNINEAFTASDRDFFDIEWFMKQTGLKYTKCAQLVREIKSVSDVFGLPGMVHRVDYMRYVNREEL